MESKYQKSYRSEPTVHKINVFHIKTAYRFFNMSCDTCKLQEKCFYIKHKSEICAVANKAEKLLLPFTDASVRSFVGDEFYIFVNRKNKKQTEEIKRIFGFLTVKYMKQYNER